MDVFGLAVQSARALGDGAIAAGHELGVFDALARHGRATVDELAAAIGITAGRHRLRALLDVLAAIGAIRCDRSATPWFAAATAAPPCPVVARGGWGQLAQVIRDDRPLPVGGAESERRFHRHLAEAGAAPAREVVPHLGHTSLLDLGAGAGAYSKAFLAAHATARATLVDTREALALAQDWLGLLAERARFVDGDASEVSAGNDHGSALLANVLHLHPADMCARLCAAAARAVAPGGVVVIKDLRIDEDRSGPLEGLLFALNMAVYTEAGDVYPTSQLRAWLSEAGLVDIIEHRLVAAPDAVVVIGRRPGVPVAGAGDGSAATSIAAELDAALQRTGAEAWQQRVASGTIHAAAIASGEPVIAFPSALRRFLAAAVALERSEGRGDAGAAERAQQLVRHYTEAMPRMRIAQLAGTDEPGATLFHARLDWAKLPRLGTAIDRLFAVLARADVDATRALGAASADGFRARTPTLARLYERTHYGGFMPLLYGSPADLAYMHARGVAEQLDALAIIDRYLTAPIVHELCHFAPDRAAIAPPHLDECVAGWLGVHVHPELAYPTDAGDALYAAPWLAQVGQALARAFGVASLVRAQAGDLAALPRDFVDTAERLGWEDWRGRRTLHFLSDTFDPAPWVALALASAAGRPLAGETLASLAALPLRELAVPPDPSFDRAIVEDGLRAMCLTSRRADGSFRTRTVLPAGPITVDAIDGAIVASARGELDPVVPRYWLPPGVASRIVAHQHTGYALQLRSLTAIPDAAAAICRASPGVEHTGFSLVPR